MMVNPEKGSIGDRRMALAGRILKKARSATGAMTGALHGHAAGILKKVSTGLHGQRIDQKY
jgi:hypothetical protein